MSRTLDYGVTLTPYLSLFDRFVAIDPIVIRLEDGRAVEELAFQLIHRGLPARKMIAYMRLPYLETEVWDRSGVCAGAA